MSGTAAQLPNRLEWWAITLHCISLTTTALALVILNLPVFIACIITGVHRKKPVNVWINMMVFIHLTEGFFSVPIYLYRNLRRDFDVQGEKIMCVIYRFVYYTGYQLLAIFIVLVSFDRLVSVRYPLRYREWMSVRGAYSIAAASILVVFILQLVPVYNDSIQSNSVDRCPYRLSNRLYLLVLVTFYILPEIVLFINYGIVLKVITSRLGVRAIPHEYNHGRTGIQPRQATKKIMIILLTYALTHSPYVIYYTIEHFRNDLVVRSMSDVSRGLLKTFIRVVALSQGICTPLLYFWFNPTFRHQAFAPFLRRLRSTED